MRPALPLPLSSFVPRDQDLAEITKRLGDARLVTLTGVGGAGKTRLALEATTRVVATTGQTPAFVDLASIADAGLVAHSVATALGVKEEPGRTLLEVLVARLDNGPVLAVFDNCEHVIDASAHLIEKLLGSCSALQVLATSREALAIAGEVVCPVPPLSLPDASRDTEAGSVQDSEAVRLFCERAGAVSAGFAVDDTNAAAVAEICRRLDGNALAIELAAARVDVLSPDQIAERLEDRFALLVRGRRSAPTRQRTLRAALAWSYDLLSPPERVLLRRLSVFVGGFTLDASEDVCCMSKITRVHVLDILSELVAKSLVVADTSGPAARYRLLESVGHYAAELLAEEGETKDLQALQAAWCVVVLEEAARQATTIRRAAPLAAHLEAEQDNVRAALEWALGEGRVKLSLRLARAQMLFWGMRGHYSEAQEWLDRVLASSDRGPEFLRAATLHDAGYVAMMLGDLDAARARLNDSVAISSTWSDPRAMIRTRSLLGFVSTFGEAAEVDDLDELLAEARATGDEDCLAESLAACARGRMFNGEPTVAAAHFRESIDVGLRTGAEGAGAGSLVGLGWAALTQGDYDEAEGHLHAGLALAQDLGDSHTEVVGVSWLGELAHRRGDFAGATQLFEQSLESARAMRAAYPICRSLLGLASVSLAGGDIPEAQRRFEEAVAVARDSGPAHLLAVGHVGLGEVSWAADDREAARDRFNRALSLARRCGDKLATALAVSRLGQVVRFDGQVDRAALLHHEALEIRHEVGDRCGVVDSIEAVAGVFVARDSDDGVAARLFGAADAMRQAGGYRRAPIDAEIYAADIAALRKRIGARNSKGPWAEGARLAPDEAVEYATRRRGARARGAGSFTLTRAERQVVALVEEGLSNPEIAERLIVSRETVKSHLSRVFAKLGVASRRELRELSRRERPDARIATPADRRNPNIPHSGG